MYVSTKFTNYNVIFTVQEPIEYAVANGAMKPYLVKETYNTIELK